MPVIKSAKKRARQEIVRRERNFLTRRRVKDARKSLVAAQGAKNKKKIEDSTRQLQSALDTAVKKNIMHKNKAARILSRALTSTNPVSIKSSVKKTTKAKKAK
jgi:small subunit ribosomal protein S20